MDKKLWLQMEQLRDRMHQKASDQQSLINREVLQLSQSLDLLIVQAQVEQRELSRIK